MPTASERKGGTQRRKRSSACDVAAEPEREPTSSSQGNTNGMGSSRRCAAARGSQCLAGAVAIVLLASCGGAADGATLGHATAASARTADPGGCPITKAPNRQFVPPVPPAPTSVLVRDGEFWYGTPALWTSLRSDGAWRSLPYHDGAYTQKVFWWSEGYDWRSALTVSGRRIDGSAPPLAASTATNASADDIGSSILVGVDIPAAGCWEITGHLKQVTLSFVVWIT